MTNGSASAPRESYDQVSAPELSIIIPTFKEYENVPLIIEKIDAALSGIHWEIIFVDDNSPDQTAAHAREIARRDSRIRCIERIGRRGLSTACIEGFLSSSAPYLAVIDADMQHDETKLLAMLNAVKKDGNDLAIGSRYAEGGGFGTWEESRIKKSQLATRLSNLVTKVPLSDPMSGFFLLKRELFEAAQPHLSSIGFKILLDIVVSAPEPIKFTEVVYEFRERIAGESKLDSMIMWEYFMLLADKTVGRYIPVRFISFGLVGATGVFVHLILLSLAFRLFSADFWTAQTIATMGAMTTNFFLNNLFTYRDRRLKGSWQLLKGWITFVAACSIGAVSNIGVAGWLYEQQQYWVFSALTGVLVGTIWNYAITSLYTWKK